MHFQNGFCRQIIFVFPLIADFSIILPAGVHISPKFAAGAGVQGIAVAVVVSPGIENSTGRSVVEGGSTGNRLDLPPNGYLLLSLGNLNVCQNF